MTEEIIIDGVDVAGCENYTTMEDCDGIHDLCEQLDDYCSIKKNCYYKQLKQAENTVNECHKYLAELEDKIESLEQENRELRKANEISIEKVTVTAEAKRLQELEQENKSLYEEKNCLHKIIDRLLENAGYSKDIASAEDFEDVYEDMQIKQNELNNYRSALEEIQKVIKSYDLTVDNGASVDTIYTIRKIINEVLNLF